MIKHNGTHRQDRFGATGSSPGRHATANGSVRAIPGGAGTLRLPLVKDWMTTPVFVIHTDTPVADAYNMMMQGNIRRLPVIEKDRLVGIVTLGDLREARPSPATSLSIYELNYLLAKLAVGSVMTHNPFTVTPGMTIQDAARVMLAHKVGGLPVVDETNRPVGIITESDIFRMLIDRRDYFTAQHIQTPHN